MTAHVTFAIVAGPGEGQSFTFADARPVVVGRGTDCALRIEDCRQPPQVSGRHCELLLDPPAVRVRDLGSLNGTRVNGLLLGNRENPSADAVPLFDGDVLALADVRLRVRTSPVLCSECQQSLHDQPPRLSSGRPICSACLNLESPTTRPPHQNAAEQLLSHAATGAPALQSLCGYELLWKLGEGGMGVVYLARHVLTRQRVALKVILPDLADRDELLTRFRREIHLAQAIGRHPNVVSAIDAGRDGDTYFYVMEYCPGDSVQAFLRGRDPLPPTEAVALIEQVLFALDHLHNAEVPDVLLSDSTTRSARGVVHRDLKPNNLLFGDEAKTTVKLADLGLAKAFGLSGQSGITHSQHHLGTPPFCSRRQWLNPLRAGPEADVWAAAACLYFLLTKEKVRDFPPGCDVVRVLMREPAVPIRQRRPDLPAALAEVIDAALHEGDEQQPPRYATAATFREALRRTTSP